MFKNLIQKRNLSHTFVSHAVKKKIEVQLLKDFEGLGKRGEIVKVLSTRMINQLHPNNGAAYILPNQGPRIPVVEKEVAAATVTPDFGGSVNTSKASGKSNTQQGDKITTSKKESIFDALDDLSFDFKKPESKPSADNDDAFFKFNSLKELPESIQYVQDAQKDGFLISPVTKKIFAEKLNSLTGYKFTENELSLYYIGQKGQVKLEKMDFVGLYNVVIKIADFKPASVEVKITSNSIPESQILVRP